VHEYRRFVQHELDQRGWKPAELEHRSGLDRQLIWKILHDKRDQLGRMPNESTMEKIALGFGIPVERVRTAAARALRGYVDDGGPLITALDDVSIDALLEEIRRRVVAADTRPGDPAAEEPEQRAGRQQDGDQPRKTDDESEPDEGPFFQEDEP
jgi:ribosomal protein L12E/L44/L45/RPP1/RPP2